MKNIKQTFRKLFFLVLILEIIIFPLFSLVSPVHAELTAGTVSNKVWGPTTSSSIYAVASDDTYTYFGGDFTFVGPIGGYGAITNTTGSTVSSIPNLNNSVYTATPDGSGGWYIGGDFTQVGKFTRNRLAHIHSDGSVDAKWNPNSNSYVYSIEVSGSDIYIGGNFTSIGGKSIGYFAKLNNTDGSADSSWNANVNGLVYDSVIDGNDIYFAGSFTSVGGQTRNRAAKVSLANASLDSSWNPNANSVVTDLVIHQSNAYVLGTFSSIGGQSRNYMAKLNLTDGSADGSWNPNPTNPGDTVYALTIDALGSAIYVGGRWSNIGGQARLSMAKLNLTDGSADGSWNAFLTDSVKDVYSITNDGTSLYAGGEFTDIGGLTRNYMAKLNTTNGNVDSAFSAGSSNAAVRIIALSNTSLFVGGSFASFGLIRNGIARIFNSTGILDEAWNPNAMLDADYSGSIYSIALSGSDVYVGGDFSTIGGLARRNMAKLNNTNGNADVTWDPSASNSVHSIAISGSDIYTGGDFTTIGGQTRNRIAKLNNTNGNADVTWNPNADSSVYSIAISDSDIYAGGEFTTIGGQTRNRIAKLNNTNGNADATWDANASAYVRSIAISGSDVYVGGNFTTIGGQTRNRIAKLNNTTGTADITWNPNAGSRVYSIAINGSDIYAGGSFTTMGGQTANRLAKLSLHALYQIASLDSSLNVYDTLDRNIEVGTSNGVYDSDALLSLYYGDYIFAKVTTAMTEDRNWSGVSGGVDITNYKSFAHSLTSAPGAESSFSLYVPKRTGDVKLGFCPSATSLAEVSTSCSGFSLKQESDSDVSVVTADGISYWKVDGLTGSGGLSYQDFPVISFTTLVSPDPTTDTTPTVKGTVTDSGGTISSVEFQIDGTSGSWTACTADDGAFDEATEAFTCTVTSALSDGSHTMYIRSTDSNGNVSEVSSDSFTVDTTAPLDFSLVSPEDKAYTSSSHPNFCFKTTTDATSGVSHYELSIGGTTKVSDIKPTCQGGVNYYDCRIEKSATSTTSPISWGRYEDNDKKIDYFGEKICVEWKQEDRNLKEGTHYWKVKAFDFAGNSRSTGERILYVDYDYVSTTPTPTPTPTFFFGSYLSGSDESANLEIVDIKKEKLKKKEKPTSYVSLTVKVVDQKGSPVEGASITLFSTPRNAKTNKEGVATFEKVERGKHKLLVKQDGYQGSENLDLTDSQVKAYVITVKLEKIDNYVPFIIIGIILLVLIFLVVRMYMRVAKE